MIAGVTALSFAELSPAFPHSGGPSAFAERAVAAAAESDMPILGLSRVGAKGRTARPWPYRYSIQRAAASRRSASLASGS